MQKKLYRSKSGKMLLGVCGGVAEYLNIDVTIIRVLWAAASLFAFFGVILYIICAIVFPEKPDNNIIDSE